MFGAMNNVAFIRVLVEQFAKYCTNAVVEIQPIYLFCS